LDFDVFSKIEGIILKVIPFGDFDQIFTLFTLEAGLLKFIFKGSQSKRKAVQGICMPLTRVEVIYQEKKSELFSCRDMALLDRFGKLKIDLMHLQAACEIAKSLLVSQFPGKPSPLLYQLLRLYLEKLSQVHLCSNLTASFRLKILKHEGLVVSSDECCQCHQPLGEIAYFEEGEWRCLNHRSFENTSWNQQERKLFDRLLNSQKFQEIISEPIDSTLKEKIDLIFEHYYLNEKKI
jgi:DNA repair protein RecO (recombination protein O)